MGEMLIPALEETSDYVRMIVSGCRHRGRHGMPDHEFFSSNVIKTLEELGAGYLMPYVNAPKVVEAIRKFAAKKHRQYPDTHNQLLRRL